MPNQQEAPLCFICGTKMRLAGPCFVCEGCGGVQQKLQFTELQKEMMKRSYVEDINHLLPQLSSSARPCTDEWLNTMFDSGTRLFVALDNDKIVGTVLLCTMVILVGRKDWIEDVVVDDTYRRHGVATVLMDMAHQVSRERGAKSINLTSKPDRGGARKMYGDMGYEVRETGVFRKTF
jgi:GNAT superfamily N-acetyltransferase